MARICSLTGGSVALILGVILGSATALLAWGNDGHEIVAYIAAAHLTPAARAGVAKALGENLSSARTIANGMAVAAIRPDREFRPHDRSTSPWHFVDLCLQDNESDIAKRCEKGCVTAKIDEYETRLRKSDFDHWGADGDLAFLIHFVGDLHQPLHDATNADRGGNCVHASPGTSELHGTWDTILVEDLERKLKTEKGSSRAGKADASLTKARSTATALDRHYKSNPPSQNLTWKSGGTNDIAWESTLIARNKIYGELNLAPQACIVELKSCAEAPSSVQTEAAQLDPAYVDEATDIVGQQLYVAGMRLASLLNQIWP